jgi:steroid delta-isomerase-like uncharacterized protein
MTEDSAGDQGRMSHEAAYEFCRRYTEAWNSHEADRLLELLTDDIVWEDPSLPEKAARGHDGVRAWLESTWRAMPDATFTNVDDQVYVSNDGRRIAAPWRLEATLLGPLEPPGFAATGSPVQMSGVDLMEDFEDNRARRIRTIYDGLGLARQIGAAPEPGTRNERVGVVLQRMAARKMRKNAPSPTRKGTGMAIRFHRCPAMINKIPSHPCWKVQKALDAAGIDYEIVKEPLLRPRRKWTIEKTGKYYLPVLELEDGTIIREESSDMVERIQSGRLETAAAEGAAAPAGG